MQIKYYTEHIFAQSELNYMKTLKFIAHYRIDIINTLTPTPARR